MVVGVAVDGGVVVGGEVVDEVDVVDDADDGAAWHDASTITIAVIQPNAGQIMRFNMVCLLIIGQSM